MKDLDKFTSEIVEKVKVKKKKRKLTNIVISSLSVCFFSGIIRDDTFTNTLVRGKNISVQVTLKKVWNIAICVLGSVNQRSNVTSLKFRQIKSITVKITEPITLNSK